MTHTLIPDSPSISLVLWGDESHGANGVSAFGSVQSVGTLPAAARALREAARTADAEWMLLWHSRLGAPPGELMRELTTGRADAYHAGLNLGTAGQPDDLDVVKPGWYFSVDPPATASAVSWRLSLEALLLRTEVVRQLGGLDTAFATPVAAGLDLGWRMIALGAIPVHEPRLMGGARFDSVPLPLADRYLLLARHLGRRWVRYAAVRRGLRSGRPLREKRALDQALAVAATTPSPVPDGARYKRTSALPRTREVKPKVSVVLPTLGRYDLVTSVLDDLRKQTVPAEEIICVDQTRPHDATVFERFDDLPLTVVAQDGLGQWLSRNEAISRSHHDLLLFLDDDSEVAPDFIEKHLQCLEDYDADISAGASLAVVGAPVPANYGFFRVADQFDSGNALVRRELLVEVGAFDRHFDRMRSGDAEFGLRAQLAGALSVHNPDAYRIHDKAATGGLRSFGSWDNYRQNGFFSPLPLPSVVYFAMRYLSPRQVREHMLLGLVTGIIPYERKRRATRSEWARYLAVAVLSSPLQAVRVGRSVAQARRMLAQGPRIPAVTPSAVAAEP